MKNRKSKSKDTRDAMTRAEAMKKIGLYGKYAALTALGTYIVLNPEKSQAQSPGPEDPGFEF